MCARVSAQASVLARLGCQHKHSSTGKSKGKGLSWIASLKLYFPLIIVLPLTIKWTTFHAFSHSRVRKKEKKKKHLVMFIVSRVEQKAAAPSSSWRCISHRGAVRLGRLVPWLAMETGSAESWRDEAEEMEERKGGQERWSKGRGWSVCLSVCLCEPIVVPLAVHYLLVGRGPFLFSSNWGGVSQTFPDSDIRNKQTELIRNFINSCVSRTSFTLHFFFSMGTSAKSIWRWNKFGFFLK